VVDLDVALVGRDRRVDEDQPIVALETGRDLGWGSVADEQRTRSGGRTSRIWK